MRSPDGEQIILERNVFVERILPASVMRGLGEPEMEVYRRPYLEPGESRRPTLTWPRQIPLDGEPADVVEIVDAYSRWLSSQRRPQAVHQRRPGRHPHRSPARVLPRLAQPARGHRPRLPLHPGRLPRRNRRGGCGLAGVAGLAIQPEKPGHGDSAPKTRKT